MKSTKINTILKILFILGTLVQTIACNEKEAPKDTQNTTQETAEKSAETAVAGTFTDTRDNKTYKTTKIGEQVWFAENLDYNSDGSTCYYDDSYCPKYGRLYDWKTARTACPSGWHLPSDDEWQTLVDFVSTGSKRAGQMLKASSGWYEDRNGTDDFGFAALPGGQVSFSGGASNGSIYGYWWSSTEHNANKAYNRNIFYANNEVYADKYDKSELLSVRCIKGYQEPPEEYTQAEKAAIEALNEKVSQIQRDNYTDKRDGKTYKTIKLGNQIWMAVNLDYNAKGSKCYENKESNCKIYGRLYNWKTAMKACPNGWVLPDDAEWQALVNFAGVEEAGKVLKSSSGWIQTGSGTDDFGFSALPGGFRYPSGLFISIGLTGNWWSSTKNSASKSSLWDMSYSWSYVYKNEDHHTYLHSVRCVKANTFTDTRDSKTYKTVKIGNQTWMAENLNVETGKSKCYGNKPDNCKKYGRLYDWNTAMKACPKGWHLPSNEEWEVLESFVGGRETAGKYLKAMSGNGWNFADDGKANGGEDKFGFSALPGGGFIDVDGGLGSFGNIGGEGYWWSSTESSAGKVYSWLMDYKDNTDYYDEAKSDLHSIRCIQN